MTTDRDEALERLVVDLGSGGRCPNGPHGCDWCIERVEGAILALRALADEFVRFYLRFYPDEPHESKCKCPACVARRWAAALAVEEGKP